MEGPMLKDEREYPSDEVLARHLRRARPTARSGRDIERLPIAPALKDAYRAQTSSGKLKPPTVELRTKGALGGVFTLIGYKSGST